MKLIGNLKKQVDKAADRAEKKSLIEEAGMALTDDELDRVAGGGRASEDERFCHCSAPDFGPDGTQLLCGNCGRPRFGKPDLSHGIS